MPGERARADPAVEVGILGRIRATVDGREVDLGGPRQQALLAAIASRAGRTVGNDVLIDAIWDGDPPDAAATTFRTYVARLRRAFDRAGVEGSTVVLTDSAGYRLADTVEVDADRFEAETAQAREHLARGELADAVRLTGDALGRWRGPPSVSWRTATGRSRRRFGWRSCVAARSSCGRGRCSMPTVCRRPCTARGVRRGRAVPGDGRATACSGAVPGRS
jgi:DNA-binding winged helix-turn-helix (wHTH) protein